VASVLLIPWTYTEIKSDAKDLRTKEGDRGEAGIRGIRNDATMRTRERGMTNTIRFLAGVIHSVAAIFADRSEPKASGAGPKKRVGIWVDSQKAFIVSVVKDSQSAEPPERVSMVRIDADREPRRKTTAGPGNGKAAYDPRDTCVEGKMDDGLRRRMKKYFQQIVAHTGDAEQILVFGPGRVKFGLEQEMRKIKRLSLKLLPVETTDALTERQIAAKVKAFFNSEP